MLFCDVGQKGESDLHQHPHQNNMFPSENRLKNDKDIKTLFARGKSVFDMSLGLKFFRNKSAFSRFTVVVGTKVSKKAVIRNKIKRRIRAIIEKRLPLIVGGFDVMILVKKEVLKIKYPELKDQVERVLKRAKLV